MAVLMVTVKDKTGEWTERWNGYDNGLQEVIETKCRMMINAFNDEERRRYGDDANLREFVSVEIIEKSEKEDEIESDDDDE